MALKLPAMSVTEIVSKDGTLAVVNEWNVAVNPAIPPSLIAKV